MDNNLSFSRSLAATMCATSLSEATTLPFDTLKVRMQLSQGKASAGVFSTLSNLIKEEGITSPWKGLTAGIHRQLTFGALRISLYTPIRDFYANNLYSKNELNQNPPLFLKIIAGVTSGFFAMLIANPVDVVKIRIQADTRSKSAPRYKSTMLAYPTIYRQEGIKGLYTGLGPNLLRNSAANASELAAYDQIKQFLINNEIMKDGLPLHFTAGLSAGFITTVVISPFDVLKTRMMNAQKGQFKSISDAVIKTTKEIGLKGYYYGFGPNFFRIGTYNVFCFILLEKFRALFNPNKE